MVLVPTASEVEYMQKHIHDNKQPQIIVANIVCIILAYIGVALRLLSRYIVKAGYKADDWWIVAGLVDLGRVLAYCHN